MPFRQWYSDEVESETAPVETWCLWESSTAPDPRKVPPLQRFLSVPGETAPESPLAKAIQTFRECFATRSGRAAVTSGGIVPGLLLMAAREEYKEKGNDDRLLLAAQILGSLGDAGVASLLEVVEDDDSGLALLLDSVLDPTVTDFARAGVLRAYARHRNATIRAAAGATVRQFEGLTWADALIRELARDADFDVRQAVV